MVAFPEKGSHLKRLLMLLFRCFSFSRPSESAEYKKIAARFHSAYFLFFIKTAKY
jgi:hypothetical protein